MIPVDQKPRQCWEACIASILEVSLDSVPVIDRDRDWGGLEAWLSHYNIRLASLGFKIIREYVPGDDEIFLIRGYTIQGGVSPRGIGHSVVALDGHMVHDPHPSRAGLTKIDCYDLLIPLDPAQNIPRTPQ
jgi:hypothetical protein